MSMLDRQNLFSNDQSITASANSTDVIDLGSSSRDVGAGETNNVLVQVTEAFNNLTSLTVTLQTASTENFASPVQLNAGTIALASLVVGAKFSIGAIPRGVLRYLRLAYTVIGSAPSTGKITAGVAVDGSSQDTVIYADAL
jgi:hypothetical protein